eukprot:765452-Hanusia_phi.AAC.1
MPAGLRREGDQVLHQRGRAGSSVQGGDHGGGGEGGAVFHVHARTGSGDKVAGRRVQQPARN